MKTTVIGDIVNILIRTVFKIKRIYMKKIILLTVFICFMNVLAYGSNDKRERDINRFIDSYHYGNEGRNCSEIYYI